ncbi:hypothetical protein [Pilimelia columellifera]|uniref:Uncharacterized protein n=1 Tax=Pilimelia columellifera subsp. columellifera TaxID=706583 RepID=A0ABP6B4A1_9ACTN
MGKRTIDLPARVDVAELARRGWAVDAFQARLVETIYEEDDEHYYEVAMSLEMTFQADQWSDRFGADRYCAPVVARIEVQGHPEPVFCEFDLVERRRTTTGPVRLSERLDLERDSVPLDPRQVRVHLTAFDEVQFDSPDDLAPADSVPVAVDVIERPADSAIRLAFEARANYSSSVQKGHLWAAGTVEFGSVAALLAAYGEEEGLDADEASLEELAPVEIGVPSLEMEVLDPSGFVLDTRHLPFDLAIRVGAEGQLPERRPVWAIQASLEGYSTAPASIVLRTTGLGETADPTGGSEVVEQEAEAHPTDTTDAEATAVRLGANEIHLATENGMTYVKVCAPNGTPGEYESVFLMHPGHAVSEDDISSRPSLTALTRWLIARGAEDLGPTATEDPEPVTHGAATRVNESLSAAIVTLDLMERHEAQMHRSMLELRALRHDLARQLHQAQLGITAIGQKAVAAGAAPSAQSAHQPPATTHDTEIDPDSKRVGLPPELLEIAQWVSRRDSYRLEQIAVDLGRSEAEIRRAVHAINGWASESSHQSDMKVASPVLVIDPEGVVWVDDLLQELLTSTSRS